MDYGEMTRIARNMSAAGEQPHPEFALVIDGEKITDDIWHQHGGLYVGPEGLDPLIDLWSDRANRARVEYYHDDLLLLLFDDDARLEAHVVEYDHDAKGWSIPSDGWWPLAWSVEAVSA